MRNCKTCRYTFGEERCRLCRPSTWFQYWEPKAQTNADRIRSMTDEELMRLLLRVRVWGRPWCDDKPCNKRFCSDCITKWLKEEVSR